MTRIYQLSTMSCARKLANEETMIVCKRSRLNSEIIMESRLTSDTTTHLLLVSCTMTIKWSITSATRFGVTMFLHEGEIIIQM